jgi:hypothetical protein
MPSDPNLVMVIFREQIPLRRLGRHPVPFPSPILGFGSMKVLITIAIMVVAIGAVLAVAGVVTAVQARRNEPRYVGGHWFCPSSTTSLGMHWSAHVFFVLSWKSFCIHINSKYK